MKHTQAKSRDKIENLVYQVNFRNWLLQHLQSFIFSLGQLCRNPVSSFLTASVIGISLALPAGFYVILENAQHITAGWEGSVEITAFLKKGIDDSRAKALADKLSKQNNLATVKLVTSEQALAEYRRLSGFGDALDMLKENPLPALLLIKPKLEDMPEKVAENLLNQLRKIPEIETAQYDQQWVKRLNAIIQIVERIVLILAVFLGMAVLLIIGNTIRILIYHRRSEIEIAKLFGATDSFIQRPFLYSGFWYGLLGGIIAWLLIATSLLILQKPADNLADLYSSNYQLISLTITESFYLLISGILLGWFGSLIAVRRHLRAIEPV